MTDLQKKKKTRVRLKCSFFPLSSYKQAFFCIFRTMMLRWHSIFNYFVVVFYSNNTPQLHKTNQKALKRHWLSVCVCECTHIRTCRIMSDRAWPHIQSEPNTGTLEKQIHTNSHIKTFTVLQKGSCVSFFPPQMMIAHDKHRPARQTYFAVASYSSYCIWI